MSARDRHNADLFYAELMGHAMPRGRASEDDLTEGTAAFPTLKQAWDTDKRRILFSFKPISTTFTDASGIFNARFWVSSDAVKWKIPASERDLLAEWNRFKEADPIDQDGDMLCRLPCTARQNQAFANALKLHPDPRTPGAEDGLIDRTAPIRSDMAPEPCLLLTPYLYARRYQQVSCKIDPVGRDPGAPIVGEAAKHNQYLNQKTTAFMRARNDSYRVPSIGDPGKIWAITNQMYVSRARNGQPSAINYGWHGPNATLASVIAGLKCLQSVGTTHDDRHVDYSQVCVLVAGWCEVTEPGQSAPAWVKTESVYTSARLCKLVTEDGKPLARVRYET
ncbi:MAG TPA: hypothetical protein VF516_04475 [Kofleriaceae bacterium]